MYKAQAWLVSKLLTDAGVEVGVASSSSSGSASSSSGRGAGSGSVPASNPKSRLVKGSDVYDTVEESGSFEYDDGDGKIGSGSILDTSQTAISNDDRQISGISNRSTHASELRVSTVDAFQVVRSLCHM
jgi:hypothetical protein